MRVYLTGFMGAGKSTVGRRLATLLDCVFVDLDAEIERAAGASVSEVFAAGGERRFRALESEALARVAQIDNVVVATGGGSVIAAANRDLMRRTGLGFWLDTTTTVVFARLAAGGDERPLYHDRGQAEAVYQERLPYYRDSGTRIEVAAGDRPGEVAARIRDSLRETRCAI